MLSSPISPALAAKTVLQTAQPGSSPESTNLLVQDSPAPFVLEDFEFWAEQCRLLDEQQDYANALTACETAISLEPKEDNIEIWAARGNALFHLGQYVQSLVSYDRVIAASPDDSFAIAYQCANFYQLGRYDDAIDSCEQALRIDGNWGTSSPTLAWYYRGLALRQVGRLETALGSFERALLINPDDPQAIAERCATLSALGNAERFVAVCDVQQAADTYERALSQNPDNIALWVQQGFALEQLGSEAGAYERALTAYNRAVELNSRNSEALARRCGVLNQLENYQTALESCEQAFQGDGQWGTASSVYAWNQSSIALSGLGKYEEALAAADRAIAADPGYAPAQNSRAVSLWRINPTDLNALAAVNQAICLYKETEATLADTFVRSNSDPPVLFYRGQILALFNKGRIFTSIAADRQATEADKEAYNLASTVADCQTEADTGANLTSIAAYNQATEAYNQALAIYGAISAKGIKPLAASTLSDIYTNLSATYLHLYDLNATQATYAVQALAASQQAIRLNRDSFAGWYNQGLAYTYLENFDAALAAYAEADRLRPNDIYVLMGRGRVLEETGQTQEAMDIYNQVLNLDPTQTAIQAQLENLMNSTKQN